MMQCEATLLGRAPVNGAVDAASLATLIRSLQHAKTEGRRYLLRFTEVLEFVPRRSLRRQDDEGFESDVDDDTASSVSNSSSCCLVDDHVFKCHPATKGKSASSPASSVAADSANSSGASDTDEPLGASPSVSDLVKSLSLFQQRNTRETYAVDEVAFCHTDPAFPRVVLWVVKKRQLQRLSPSGADTSSGLEAVVFECQREELLKKLCASFQEKSRRAKLEKQYRHPHRRKEPEAVSAPVPVPAPAPVPTTDKVSALSQVQVTVKPVLPDLLKGTRFNLVQRTDGDGVTHIEVSRGLPLDPSEDVDEELCGGPSSIISISTPDIGNLRSKSRLCKEIEGVIRSDVDSASPRRERQRQPAILVVQEDDAGKELRKVWTPEPETPPQRPERRRKVKSPAPQPPGQLIRVAVNTQPAAGWVYPHYQKNRTRQASSRSKSPPARRPMAYRYIDAVVPTNSLSNRFFGLSQKLREITSSSTSTLSRRRNSLGELPARFEYLGEGKNGNLKSVIKKTGGGRLGEYTEPKKVTFSAYATVQVVD